MSLIPWKAKRTDGDVLDAGIRSPLNLFRSEVDRLFDLFFRDPFGTRPGGWGSPGDWVPSLDVTETDTEVTVRAEVPGVDPKDLDISVSGQVLTIAGEKNAGSERKGENYYHCERRFGSFRRSVELPSGIDSEKMSAEHRNGVVVITFKKNPAAARKRIPIKASAG
ncbi:MAG: Hsp20/alpha crystallin family protein [Planctomycetes bacterium]|nr:Hsp20/alpha crystallin family protein [Planctomycetota bacterium]